MPEALVVDDDPNFLAGLAAVVEKEGFGIRSAHSLKEARLRLSESMPDMVLLDVNLPDGSGLDLLREIGSNPPTEVVIITGHGSITAAVEAMRMGASNYLTKPLDLTRVKALLMGVVQTIELKEQIGTLRTQMRKLGRFGSLVGVSPPMQKVYDLITKVAPTDATIMLVGETGTGKELVARSVHDLSGRRKHGFIAVNCGAISPNLVSSELFGHEKGSFTGADRQHRGYFELANKGTLFLDEITETPLDLQVDLLRVLETNSFRRVGGPQSIDVDVRVIAATNLVPAEAVTQGKLREDLLYRLNVFPIHLPPLRERIEDVDLLAEHILGGLNSESSTCKRFTPASFERLRAHSWPGNVRELRNVIRRAFILAEDEIDIDSIHMGTEQISRPHLHMKVGSALADVERRLIFATLEHSAGDKKAAAAILGISLKTLYNRLNEYKAQQ